MVNAHDCNSATRKGDVNDDAAGITDRTHKALNVACIDLRSGAWPWRPSV